MNRGCIPSKMLAYTADLAMQVRRGPQFGLQSVLMGVEWPDIRDRVAARIAETSNSGREARRTSPTVTLFEGHARFVAPHELVIDEDVHISAEQIVIATGSHPLVPEVVNGSGVDFHTSDSVMWLDVLPSSMIVTSRSSSRYRNVAYGWAMGDPMGICKIYADPVTERVLGAHVLGEQASLLITPLIQAAAHGQ